MGRFDAAIAPADAERFNRRSVAIAVTDPGSKQTGFRMFDLASGTMTGKLEEESAIDATDIAYSLDVSSDVIAMWRFH